MRGMSDQEPNGALVQLKCICGERLLLDPEILGRMVKCPACRRLLRPALQFLLLDESVAPNITVPCLCGRFIVESLRRAGKQVQCAACGQRLVLPRPADRPNAPPVVRVSPETLKKQLRRPAAAARKAPGSSVLKRSAAGKTITLKPGQQACVNENCKALLPLGSVVCPCCGTNIRTGVIYEGIGPSRDPVGKWRMP